MKKTDHPYHDHSMWKGATQQTFLKAMELRSKLTKAEKCLKDILNKAHFEPYNFRCQHPIGIYIVDFYSHKLKLVLEVDGPYHHSKPQKENDKERTEFLESYNITVLRFTNRMVINNSDRVEEIIKTFIQSGFSSAL